MNDRLKFLFFHVIMILLLAACSTRSTPSSSNTEVTQVVEEFGKKLQTVSLLSPHVAEEISREYSEFVSPDLLNSWISDPTRAPGRMVSSPWPDMIEILSVSQISDDGNLVSGEIIEITSSELVSGGVANTIPVRVTVQWFDGHWLITEFVEEKVKP
jgi:hypothetical protein